MHFPKVTEFISPSCRKKNISLSRREQGGSRKNGVMGCESIKLVFTGGKQKPLYFKLDCKLDRELGVCNFTGRAGAVNSGVDRHKSLEEQNLVPGPPMGHSLYHNQEEGESGCPSHFSCCHSICEAKDYALGHYYCQKATISGDFATDTHNFRIWALGYHSRKSPCLQSCLRADSSQNNDLSPTSEM